MALMPLAGGKWHHSVIAVDCLIEYTFDGICDGHRTIDFISIGIRQEEDIETG